MFLKNLLKETAIIFYVFLIKTENSRHLFDFQTLVMMVNTVSGVSGASAVPHVVLVNGFPQEPVATHGQDLVVVTAQNLEIRTKLQNVC